MKKIKQSKIKDSSPAEQKFGVLLEHLDGKFDQVLESRSAMQKEVEDFRYEVRKEFGFLNMASRVLQQGQKDLLVKVERLQDSAIDTQKNFKTIFDYFSNLDDELKSIKLELADLKLLLVNKVGIERFENLERKIKDMEIRLTSFGKSGV